MVLIQPALRWLATRCKSWRWRTMEMSVWVTWKSRYIIKFKTHCLSLVCWWACPFTGSLHSSLFRFLLAGESESQGKVVRTHEARAKRGMGGRGWGGKERGSLPLAPATNFLSPLSPSQPRTDWYAGYFTDSRLSSFVTLIQFNVLLIRPSSWDLLCFYSDKYVNVISFWYD